MKKLLLLFLLTVSSFAFGQNLTLSELFSICNKSNWDEVNEYLLKKGWEYHESTKGDNEHYSTITWAYNKEYYSDKAQGWFYLYTYEGLPNKLSYSFFNKQSYNTIKSGVTAAGMKLVDNSIEDNELVTKYSGANFFVSIRTAKREKEESYSGDNSITAYSVVVIKKTGVYDSDNGKKTDYYEGGQIKAEYYLTNGKLNGQLKVYHENGNIQRVGTYVNGKENGRFIEYDEDGKKTAEYPMVNGEINGVLTIYKDGLKSQEITKQNGVSNGKFVAYYYSDEGKLHSKLQGAFLDEKKDGLWQTFIISEGKEELIEYTTYSNDEKNGAFKEYVNSDSLETGTYKNGILNGYFKRKTKMTGFEGKNFESEVTWWNMESEGNYINGLEDGKWIYYFFGGKSEEGNYQLGNKTGKWIKYVRMGNYADKIQQETNYTNGKENGLCKRYFEFETVSDSTDGNPSIKFINIPIQESSYYKDGIKEGEYALKDSAGILISKGNFSNDKKNGTWTESYLMEESDGKSVRVYQKGNYSSDNKTGIWQEYIDENSVLEIQTYKNGELDGKTTRFNSFKKPSEIFQFSNGELKSLEVYDTLGNNITHKYEINSRNGELINCNYIIYNKNTATTQGYEFISSFKEFNPYFFNLDFIFSVSDSSAIVYEELYQTNSNQYIPKEKPTKNEFISNPVAFSSNEITTINEKGWKKEGLYELREISSNKILISGSYKNNLQNGKWKTYYYDNGIYTSQNFIRGKGDLENYFLINNNQPFNGKFELKYKNGNPKLEYKISNGLRDGKSKYYDENGNQVKTEKYSKGLLQD